MSDERCHACDRPVATQEQWDHGACGQGGDGCECDACCSVCWGGPGCQANAVDWRARALKAEAALTSAASLLRGLGYCSEADELDKLAGDS